MLIFQELHLSNKLISAVFIPEVDWHAMRFLKIKYNKK